MTFAEAQRSGKAFWEEFELYLPDLLVGISIDVALVGLWHHLFGLDSGGFVSCI